ncbi:MAG: hypothetical protein ACRDT6_27850 [Micromonosporaceae bacterium]
MGSELYAVIEVNQASGQPDSLVGLWGGLGGLFDAQQHAHEAEQDSRARGRQEKYRVYELVEMEDDD